VELKRHVKPHIFSFCDYMGRKSYFIFACGVLTLALGTRWIQMSLVELTNDVGYVAPWPVYLGAKALFGSLERAISDSMPPGALVLRTATAYVLSASLTAVVELQVADALALRGGCATLNEVSADVGVSRASALGKTLTLLQQFGIFERGSDMEGRGRTWCLNSSARLLVSSHPHSLRDAVLFLGGPEHTSVTLMLSQSLLSGGVPSGFAAMHGGASLWEHLGKNSDRAILFDGAMRAVEETERSAILADGGLEMFDIVVDLGGGHGGLMAALLDENPHLSGVIVDRAPVINAAHARWATNPVLVQHLKTGRISFEIGDVFPTESHLNLGLASMVPGQRVAIVLKHIIHDWNTVDSLTILGNVAKAMPANASLILIERILDEDTTFVGDHGSFISSQLMFAMFGAEERSLAELDILLSQVGFDIYDTRPTRSAVSVVHAHGCSPAS